MVIRRSSLLPPATVPCAPRRLSAEATAALSSPAAEVGPSTTDAFQNRPIAKGGPEATRASAPVVGATPAAAEAASRSVELGRVAVGNYQSDLSAGGHDGVRRELRTYQVGQPFRMAWPNHPGGSAGNLGSTRCNVFAYNMGYRGGLALPTQHYQPGGAPHLGPTKSDRPVGRATDQPVLSDVLAPAELAAPLRSTRARDPHAVRSYFQRIDDASQARPGDWVLYHEPPNTRFPHGHWGHVDVVSEAPVTRPDGDTELRTIGAGTAAGPHGTGREMYSNGQVRISGETVHGSANFDRAMVIRPTQARPPGQTDPNKT